MLASKTICQCQLNSPLSTGDDKLGFTYSETQAPCPTSPNNSQVKGKPFRRAPERGAPARPPKLSTQLSERRRALAPPVTGDGRSGGPSPRRRRSLACLTVHKDIGLRAEARVRLFRPI